MKRILLFLVTNLAVVLVLGIVLNVLAAVFGINMRGSSGLLLMAAVFGLVVRLSPCLCPSGWPSEAMVFR